MYLNLKILVAIVINSQNNLSCTIFTYCTDRLIITLTATWPSAVIQLVFFTCQTYFSMYSKFVHPKYLKNRKKKMGKKTKKKIAMILATLRSLF